MSIFTDYKKELMDAAHNKHIRVALSRAITSYRTLESDTLGKFPHTVKMAEEVRQIKEKSIGKMEELTKQACEAITYNKGKTYIAKTAQEALNIIGELVGSNKLIVKGKSMTGEEIELRKYLEEQGN